MNKKSDLFLFSIDLEILYCNGLIRILCVCVRAPWLSRQKWRLLWQVLKHCDYVRMIEWTLCVIECQRAGECEPSAAQTWHADNRDKRDSLAALRGPLSMFYRQLQSLSTTYVIQGRKLKDVGNNLRNCLPCLTSACTNTMKKVAIFY